MDIQAYDIILNAAENILRNNAAQLGNQFCNEFMNAYNVRANNQQSYSNAQFFFNYVVEQTRRQNGNDIIRDNDQLFSIVGSFVSGVFDNYANKVRQQQQNHNFGNGGGFGGFGGNSGGFNRPSSGFNFNSNRTTAGPASHLVDDTQGNKPTPQAAPSPTLNVTASAAKDTVQTVNYNPNPLDEVQDSSANFAPVKTRPIWGDEKAKDNRIVIAKREDVKSERFMVNRFSAFHQLILDDPMDVVRDFFDIVPDQTLGSPFIIKILYNHLDRIDVPTQALADIRKACIEAVEQAERDRAPILLHKQITKIIESLPTGQWKALTSYLVHHINHALYLNARLTSGANGWSIASKIKLGTFDDVNDLLSSSFNHPLTTHPDGRRMLEAIVSGVLWNVLVVNSSLMFDDGTVPTHALQSSPAFPFSMEGVYPNKFSIPMENEENAKTFIERLKEKELSQRSYFLSRRSVVITNMLGKNILPYIKSEATIINNPLAKILNEVVVSYGHVKPSSHDLDERVEPVILDDYPSQQLDNYYSDSSEYDNDNQGRISRIVPTKFPVDQTIFAMQFGMDPKKYLMAMDIFSTIDNNLGSVQMVLAKKTIQTIKTL